METYRPSIMDEIRCKGMEMADSTDHLLQNMSANGPRVDCGPPPSSTGPMHTTDPNIDELVTLNVGGARFVTNRSTLDRVPNTRLSNLHKSDKNFNIVTQEWFFDRNPALFNFILDYYRSDELHLPHNFCGPSVKKELIYWHISESDISPCCWNRYREFEEEKKIFDRIDQAFESRNNEVMMTFTAGDISNPSFWQIWRRRIFLFLEEPMSSRPAQVSLTFPIVLILFTSIVFIPTYLEQDGVFQWNILSVYVIHTELSKIWLCAPHMVA